jgi:hypothetical protein
LDYYITIYLFTNPNKICRTFGLATGCSSQQISLLDIYQNSKLSRRIAEGTHADIFEPKGKDFVVKRRD